MRKSIQNLLAIVLLICVLLTATPGILVNAVSTPDITATIVEAVPGSSVSVVISLNNNPGIWGLGLNVGYDHDALTLNSYTVGSIFTEGEVIPVESLDKKDYFFVAARDSLDNTTNTGKLVTLNFTIANEAAYNDYAISLQLSNENTINNKVEEVALNCSNGKISVIKCIHESSKWVTVELPTCEKNGSENLVCDSGNEVLDTRIIAALGHSFTKKVVSLATKRSDATYTDKATYFYTCQLCGEISNTLYFEDGDVLKSSDTDGGNVKPEPETPIEIPVITGNTDEPEVINGNTDEPAVITGSTDEPAVTTGSTKEPAVTTGSANKPSVTIASTKEPAVTTDSKNEVTVTTEDNKQEYRIIKGENSEWKTGSEMGLSITADGDSAKFSGIEVDDVLVDANHYTLEPGDTVVTLNPEYLGNLSEGKHTLTVVYPDGEASTKFTITKEETTPKTVDDSKSVDDSKTVDDSKKFPWVSSISIVIISAAVISFIYLKRKKAK
ncbi:cohesin domain-containing protein [Clostridium grantii]|uniref:Carbohydrate binding domain X2 n=1 Tax=Clostridium grantii DSM 8605 TaxID=1121316 RepID=A0A1M5T256_9CLOT|nr:cohesin domain-containing protein [Clostridium grantii]SHH44805.1 Carbohydrate binding domain X2 [Clostridium grantii DSM 8605]